MKQISDNEIYLLIKYIKSVLWRIAKRLSYIEDARCLKVNTLRPQYTASKQWYAAADNERLSFILNVSKYCYRPHHDSSLFIMKFKEYQNMIYIYLRSVNLPPTVTNKRSHDGQGSADDLIKQYESGEISKLAIHFSFTNNCTFY